MVNRIETLITLEIAERSIHVSKIQFLSVSFDELTINTPKEPPDCAATLPICRNASLPRKPILKNEMLNMLQRPHLNTENPPKSTPVDAPMTQPIAKPIFSFWKQLGP